LCADVGMTRMSAAAVVFAMKLPYRFVLVTVWAAAPR
jgi:hypothetical protein